MKHHKKKALEEKCMCDSCPNRFECFTQERVFSDPIFQGLFEALIAQGHSKEEALDMVSDEIKSRISPPIPDSTPWAPVNPPWGTQPWTIKYECWDSHDSSDVRIGSDGSSTGGYMITYTMNNGEIVSWNAAVSEPYKSR